MNEKIPKISLNPEELTTDHPKRFDSFKEDIIERNKESVEPPFVESEPNEGEILANKINSESPKDLELFDLPDEMDEIDYSQKTTEGVPLTKREANIRKGIGEDIWALNDPDNPIDETRREGWEKNIDQRLNSHEEAVAKRQQDTIKEKTKNFQEQYDAAILDSPEIKKEHERIVSQEAEKEFKEKINLSSLSDSEGNPISYQDRVETFKDIEKRFAEAGLELPESKKKLRESLKKAVVSNERLDKRDKEFGEKTPWKKFTGLPRYAAGRTIDGFRAGRDVTQVYEDYLIDKIDSAENYPLGKVGKGVSKFGVRGVSGILKNTLPVLGFAALFGFSWLLDFGLNKITAWRKKHLWDYEKTFGLGKKKK